MAVVARIISEFNPKGVKQAESSFAKLGRMAGGALAVGALTQFGRASIEAAESAATAEARIRQVATSMDLYGDRVGAVTDRLVELSKTTARQTGIDYVQIQALQAKLLTFAELAKSADSVGGAFDRATQAAIDLAATNFGSLEQNATQLGRALQDPTKGLTALTKSGVTFTASQRDMITTLVESGRTLEAQNLILEAIETQVGGVAVATANATDKMAVAFTELKASAGEELLPTLAALVVAMEAMRAETEGDDGGSFLGRLLVTAREVLDPVYGARRAFERLGDVFGWTGDEADKTADITDKLANRTIFAGDAAEDAAPQFRQLTQAALRSGDRFAELTKDALEVESAFATTIGTLGSLDAAFRGGAMSAAEQADQLNAAKIEVIDYAERIGGIPPAALTEIMTLLDKGSFEQAAAALARLAAPRVTELLIRARMEWATSNNGPGGNSLNPTKAPTAAAFGAGADWAKAYSSAFNSGMRSFRSGGGGGGGGGATPRTAEEVMSDWDELIGRLYELGEWDVKQYRAHLTSRLGAYAKYSDDYMRVWSALQTLDKQAADAARQALEDERDLMSDRFELNEIDAATYRRFLVSKLKAFDKYSDGYMAITREIAKVDADAAKAAEERLAAEDRELNRKAMQSIVAANIGGATYATINTAADPQSVINAIQQYERRNGSGWRN